MLVKNMMEWDGLIEVVWLDLGFIVIFKIENDEILN